MLAEENAVPIEPYMGGEYDMTLYQLEQYLLNFRWGEDVRQKIG